MMGRLRESRRAAPRMVFEMPAGDESSRRRWRWQRRMGGGRRRWKEESECAESWKRKRGTRCTRAREVEL